MKLLVSCDQVFDVLTRGPFPAGHDSDEAVERHLRCCYECRQLAEALQPAIALLHEAIARDQNAALPEYQGQLFAPTSTPRVRLSPEMLSGRALDRFPEHSSFVHPRSRTQGQLVSAARLFAGVTLAGALAILAWGVGSSLHESLNPQQLTMVPAAPRQHQPTPAGLVTLASLKLPHVCFPLPIAQSIPVADSNEEGWSKASTSEMTVAHVCCTSCHHAGKPDRPAARSIAKLQQSCNACHDESHES